MSPQGFYEVEKIFQITDTIATINNSKRKGFKNIFHSGLIRENEKKKRKKTENEQNRKTCHMDRKPKRDERSRYLFDANFSPDLIADWITINANLYTTSQYFKALFINNPRCQPPRSLCRL